MELTEAAQNATKQFEEGVWSRKQYLETARGHYLSALAVLTGGKQEQTKVCLGNNSSLILKDNAFKQAAEVQQASTSGQQGQGMTFAKRDVQIHMPNGVFQASEKDLQAVKLQFNKALAKNTRSQITEMVCKLGSLGKEMKSYDASCGKSTRKVSSGSDDDNEPLPKTVVESGSLHRMVESLKAELENLKKEHADLKDIDVGADFAARNLHIRLLKSDLENEDCIASRDKTKQTSEEVTQGEDEVNDLKVKTKGLKRDHDAAKFSAKVEKRQRTAFDVEEPKDGLVRALDQVKSFPEGSYPTCVSTSESTARILISEDELESSSQLVGEPAKIERGALTTTMGGVEGDKCDYSSEFSIRDFVFAARNRDISMNWPFSQNNLQLCLKHGVKDVLPPFQPIDSLRDSTMKRCLAEKILCSEESNHDGKTSILKNNLGPSNILDMDHSWNQEPGEDYRDSDSSPTERERDLAFKTIVIVNSQSEVESVSTSNLPSSEVSDEREVAASGIAKNKAKSSASQLSNKKCKVAVKMRLNSKRNTPEDITSACTVPPEAISSKICPVCENFSSSSNTTLNAHIDQCLSSQPPPTWVKSSKLSKPRIKPRKMRSMTDICTTAPCCTLEDLDRRNGTNWASNVDFPLDDVDMPSERKTPKVSARYIINNVDDGSVYIDSSGTKIRILSKLNDTSPLSFSKTSEDLRLKKQSRKGRRSKLFSSNRKKHLAKHLKYLKVTHQRKRFSSLKVKVRSTEACGTEEALHEMRDRHKKQEQAASFVKGNKAEGQNHPVVRTANRWISFKISNMSKKNGSGARCEVQAAKDSLIGNDQVGSAQRGNSPVRYVTCVQNNFKTTTYPSGADERRKGSCKGKTSSGPSLRSAVRANREVFKVSLKLGAADFDEGITKESTPRSSNSTTVPAPLLEKEVDVQPNSLQDADISVTASRKLLRSCHVDPSEGVRSRKLKTNTLAPNLSHAHVSHSTSDQMDSVSCDCSGDKRTDTCSAEASQQSGAMMHLPKSRRVTDSLGRSSLAKVRQKPAQEHGRVGLKDIKRINASDDTHGNIGCHKLAMKDFRSDREFTDPVSSSSLALGVHEAELDNDADVSPQSESLQCPNKFQGPLCGGAEARGNLGQLGQSDEREMFYGNVAEAENMSLREGDYVLNFGPGIFFTEVDPIPIPGPPGSDLPSFSDMGSEDRKSSQSVSLAQPSGDGDDDLSESPLSATSTISNLGGKDNFSFNEQKSLSTSISILDNVYAGWLGTNPGPLPGISTVTSQFAAVERERVSNSCVNSLEKDVINLDGSSAMPNLDNQQCCSHQEGITWMNSRESQFLGQRSTSSESFSGVIHTNSTLNGRSNVPDDRPVLFSSRSYHISESSQETNRDVIDPFSRTSDYDSACPSAPVLRLMGKDLMVSNSMETDLSRSSAAINVGVNGLVHPVSESSSRVKSWKPPSQYPAFMGALLHGQDPHFLSGRHFEVGPLNALPSFGTNNHSSGSMYVNEPTHASFSPSLGAAPLQR